MKKTLCIFVLFANSLALAQEDSDVGKLTADQKKALTVITERSVQGTVSFLASDELAGRGTGTPEFKIAATYVAARMRAAGLSGGAKSVNGNESFYQLAEMDTIKTPSTRIVFKGDRTPAQFGMLAATSNKIDYRGRIAKADLESDDEYDGPVWLPEKEEYTGTRGISRLSRDVTQVRRRGATAVLLQVGSDSRLITMARQNQQTPRPVSRRGISLPVLLIEKEDLADGEYRLVLPVQIKGKKKVRNVIGVLKGSDPKLAVEAVIFSAHLDHLGTRQGGSDSIYNGADDNASGVTGVLALADAYGSLQERPKRTLIFMTFWGEERGLLGSRYFVEKPLWPLDKVVAMINLEMIGRPEDGARNKAWMTGWDQSNLGTLMAIGAKRTNTLIFEHPRFSQMLYGASDNAPLVRKGVIAHSFSAGSLHKDYHQPGDHWEKLEIDHMTAVIKGLFAASLPIANGKLTPKKTRK
jgi:hypothetical protein